jgi:alkanesulfonate monooxygenase SsuD/methylene tetrahydromethanopterin reductase-like flavin-dependent oxidoreductase (luciferase family)
VSASFGLLLPTREAMMTQERPEFGRILELAEAAEALGLDSVWAGDSILARPRFEAVTTLAAVAARTERVRLGTAVLLPALRQPVVLANELASLDLISGGRVILGTGTASRNAANEREAEALGLPFGMRIGVYEESVEVMRRLWTEEAVHFHGRHFHLDGVSAGLRPVQAEGIPIWFSAGADPSFRRVVEHGDGWITLAASPEAFATAWGRVRELASEAGRDVSGLGRAAYVTLNIDDNAEAAETQMHGFVEGYYGERYEDHIRTHAFRGGPAEQCAEWLAAFLDAGAGTVIVRFSRPDQREQLERFAREVLPLVAWSE